MKMNSSALRTLVAISILLALYVLAGTSQGFARDLKVSLPRRSVSTPTQKLNREGVAELKHGHQNKADDCSTGLTCSIRMTRLR